MGNVANATKGWFQAMKALRAANDENGRVRARAVLQGAFNDLVRAYSRSPRSEWDEDDKQVDAVFDRFGE
jgi:hypothetical protein